MKIVRHFENTNNGSNKFWEISLSGKKYTLRWGKIGSAGRTKEKSLSSADDAVAQYEKLIAQKMNDGYVEKQKAP
ncbi:MAG TPA: WGR domain-containing protein, partial [Spirochaetota bacterium]